MGWLDGLLVGNWLAGWLGWLFCRLTVRLSGGLVGWWRHVGIVVERVGRVAGLLAGWVASWLAGCVAVGGHVRWQVAGLAGRLWAGFVGLAGRLWAGWFDRSLFLVGGPGWVAGGGLVGWL